MLQCTIYRVTMKPMHAISSDYQACEILPDARHVHIRPIQPSDRETLQDGFKALSPSSVRNRFFSQKRDLNPDELDFLTIIDLRTHVALVAELVDGEIHQPAGVARFVILDDKPGHAELAITIADELQGIGIGRALLRHLIACARELELDYLDATILAENARMSRLLRHTGLPLETHTHDAISELSLTL